MLIYTHTDLDIDAASSAALACLVYSIPIEQVYFINAGITKNEFKTNIHLGNEKIKPCYLILDVDCEGLGIKGKQEVINGRTYVNSAFSSLLDYININDINKAFSNVAVYIDNIDSHKNINKNSTNDDVSFFTTFIALKKVYTNDKKLLLVWKDVIEGIYSNYLGMKLAIEEANNAQWPYNNIAVIKNSRDSRASKILLNRGANFVIYQNGNNIGILINDEVPRTIATLLGQALPEWFVHPSEFLVAWGTKKDLKAEPPKINTKELSKLINEIYN